MSESSFLFNPQDEETVIPGLTVRYTQPQDAEYLNAWLSDPSVNLAFPMCNPMEVDDAVRRWISFSRIRSSLTAEINGVPCGIVTLYIQAYKRLQHQAEFGIIVSGDMRNKGIGFFLLRSVMRLAKEQFHLELLHLQVYADNPAIRLYKRCGFREFGRQSHWIKEVDANGQAQPRYLGRIFMERFL